MKRQRLLFLLLAFTILSCQRNESVASDEDTSPKTDSSNNLEIKINNGKKLFSYQCVQCHSINSAVIGPALSGMPEMNSDWLYKWIKSANSLIKSGDKQARRVFEVQ